MVCVCDVGFERSSVMKICCFNWFVGLSLVFGIIDCVDVI